MDPELDYGDMGQIMAPPEPAPIPDSWNQAKSLRFQKLQAADSEVDDHLAEGIISPEQHAELKRQVQSELLPLRALQKQAQGQALEESQQQAMAQLARVEAVQHQGAIYRARGLQERVSTYTDPLSGQTAHLYEQEPGKWGQIEFPEQASEGPTVPGGGLTELAAASMIGSDADEGLSSTRNTTPPNDAMTPPDYLQGTQRLPQMDQQEPAAPPPPAPPQTVPNGDGTHTMEIWNGPNRELLTFHGNQLVNKVAFDAAGNPIVAGQEQQGLIPQHIMAEAYKRAVQTIGPRPQGVPHNRNEAVALAHAQRNWDNRAGSMQRDIVQNWSRNQQQQANFAQQGAMQTRREEEDRKKEQALKERKESDTKKKEHHDDFIKDYKDNLKALQAERDKLIAENRRVEESGKGKQVPLEGYPHLASDAGMRQAARDNTVTDWGHLGKELPDGVKATLDKERQTDKDAKTKKKDVDPDQVKAYQDLLKTLSGYQAPVPAEAPPPAPSLTPQQLERRRPQATGMGM